LTSPGTALWFGVVVLTASWFTVRAMLGAVRAAAYACATGRAATALGLRLVALGRLFGLTNVNSQSFMHPLLPSNIDTPIADPVTALGFLGAGSAALGGVPARAGRRCPQHRPRAGGASVGTTRPRSHCGATSQPPCPAPPCTPTPEGGSPS